MVRVAKSRSHSRDAAGIGIAELTGWFTRSGRPESAMSVRPKMPRFAILPLALILMCDAAPADNRIPPASDVVRYGKAIDVAILDPELRSQKLQDWIASPRLHLRRVRWSLGDCDLQPNDARPETEYPICVRINFRLQAAWGWMSVKVGNVHEGIHGRPAGVIRDMKRLSELPRLLDAAVAKH